MQAQINNRSGSSRFQGKGNSFISQLLYDPEYWFSIEPATSALQPSALPTELILYTNKWALRVYTCTISIKYYEREKFLTIFQDIFKMNVEWHCALISCKAIRSNFFSRSKDVLIDIALSKNKKEDETLKYTDSLCTRCLEDLCWRLLRQKVQAFFKNTMILFVVPPNFCVSIVFNFSLELW